MKRLSWMLVFVTANRCRLRRELRLLKGVSHTNRGRPLLTLRAVWPDMTKEERVGVSA
jgi:hypothetical protein